MTMRERTYNRRVRAPGRASIAAVDAATEPTEGSPVVEHRDTSRRTRSGWWAARACAIIPPRENPRTSARATPSTARASATSSAMSSTVYCPAGRYPLSSWRAVGGALVARNERPVSRLSTRSTRCPCDARASTNASGHVVRSKPSPVISTTGRPSRGPSVRTHRNRSSSRCTVRSTPSVPVPVGAGGDGACRA